MKRNEKVLEGNKISLYPITIDDTDLIVRWRNDPAVQKNFIFRDVFTREMHLDWMHKKVLRGEVVQYIIKENNSGRPIGSIYYRDIDQKNNSAEFGIFIGESDARGQGYGTEATQLFSDFGLKTLNLHRIFLRLISGNDRAFRTYEHAGFQKEGVAKDMVLLDGKYRDVIFMALLAPSVKLEDEK